MKKLMSGMIQKIVLILCLITLFLVKSIYSYAMSGSITIDLISHADRGVSAADVEFQIYQVGGIPEERDSLQFYSVYGIENYPQTAEEMEAAIKIVQSKIEDEPLKSGRTDINGRLLIDNLENGIYFITANPNNEYGEIMPFIIQLPYYEIENGTLTGPIYEVVVEPKSEPHSDATDTTESAQESESIGESTDSQGKESSNGTNNKNGGTAEKTGDTALTGLYLCIAVSSVLVLLLLVTRMKRQGRKNP